MVTTRDEAVEYLTARGLHAAKRDWAPEETVFAGTMPRTHDGITVYERAAYIVPHESGWAVHEVEGGFPTVDAPLTMADACERVVFLLEGASGRQRDETS